MRGAIVFPTHRQRAVKRETGWERRIVSYEGEIEFFGVYCPENDKVYLVPLSEVHSAWMGMLRVEPPKNNQRKRIQWADDYLLK